MKNEEQNLNEAQTGNSVKADVSGSLPIDKNFEIVKGLLKWIKAQDIEWGEDLDIIFKPDFTDKNFTPKKRQ